MPSKANSLGRARYPATILGGTGGGDGPGALSRSGVERQSTYLSRQRIPAAVRLAARCARQQASLASAALEADLIDETGKQVVLAVPTQDRDPVTMSATRNSAGRAPRSRSAPLAVSRTP
jgi:hypothetical protein